MTTFTLPAWFLRFVPLHAASRSSARPGAFELLAGQSAVVDLRRGEALRVATGRVRLRAAPRALGDVVLQVEVVLRQGEVHRSVDREAVVVVAQEKSRVERLC